MAKRRKHDEDGTASGGVSSQPLPMGGDDATSEVLRNLPPEGTPAYFKALFALNSRLMARVAAGEKEFPKGYNPAQVQDVIAQGAKLLYNINPKHLIDTRTEAEKMQDAVDRLIENGHEALTLADAECIAIKEQMDRADHECTKILGGTNDPNFGLEDYDEEDPGDDPEKKLRRRRRRARKWADLAGRLKYLHRRGREPYPGGPPANEHGLRAAHPLRYMVYVARAEGDTVMHIGHHHAKMACAEYEAKIGKCYQRKNESDPESLRFWTDPEVIDGVTNVCPPGHGKSTLAQAASALETSIDPSLRTGVVHANAKEAEKIVQHITSFFDVNEPMGRRNRALFPGIDVEQSNTSTLRLKLRERQKQPTYKAYGITSAASGADLDRLHLDDAIDQKVAEQEAERTRLGARLSGTWRRRLRGKPVSAGGRAFERNITTLWHHDDPNCQLIKLVRARKAKIRVCIQRCGGPEAGVKKVFEPLWPEKYPESALRRTYMTMNNPRLYAAAFMADPQPESMRKIKRLRYYDPTTEEHKRFMDSAIFHLTMDPTATNSEKADHAGMLYGACGDVTRQDSVDLVLERKLRIVDAQQFHANQVECAAAAIDYSRTHSVHYLHVETRGSTNATAMFIENAQDDDGAPLGLDVIRHDPGNRKKEQRLNDCAALLDDSLQEKGLPAAAIEFPGVMENGVLVCHPEFRWLEEQILSFGVVKADHCVDALTQLARHLMNELHVGMGAQTRKIAKASGNVDERLLRMFGSYENPSRTATAGNDDAAFARGAFLGH